MQARLLYHEAATLEATDAKAPYKQRMELLQSALSSAIAANDLCPESLSCAALRATIIVNVLVEATASSGAAGSTVKPALPSGELCEELRYQLSGAMEACGRALASHSQLAEPSIAINADQMKTCDPCSLVSAILMSSTARGCIFDWQEPHAARAVQGGPSMMSMSCGTLTACLLSLVFPPLLCSECLTRAADQETPRRRMRRSGRSSAACGMFCAAVARCWRRPAKSPSMGMSISFSAS